MERTLDQIADEIRKHTKEARSHVFSIGKLLYEAKQKFPKVHASKAVDGGWSGWVQRSCNLSVRHAYEVMDAYAVFANIAAADRFDDCAMYLLARPSTPADARKDAFALAKSGEPIEFKTARELVKKYAPHKRPINREEMADKVRAQAIDWIDAGMPKEHKITSSLLGKLVVDIVRLAMSHHPIRMSA